jgi:hypothetical protein
MANASVSKGRRAAGRCHPPPASPHRAHGEPGRRGDARHPAPRHLACVAVGGGARARGHAGRPRSDRGQHRAPGRHDRGPHQPGVRAAALARPAPAPAPVPVRGRGAAVAGGGSGAQRQRPDPGRGVPPRWRPWRGASAVGGPVSRQSSARRSRTSNSCDQADQRPSPSTRGGARPPIFECAGDPASWIVQVADGPRLWTGRCPLERARVSAR